MTRLVVRRPGVPKQVQILPSAYERICRGFYESKKMKMKVYVASSWRNMLQQGIVHVLRAAGFEVYDFRHPVPGNNGFSWSEIDPNWKEWTPEQHIAALDHPIAVKGFMHDMKALRECDICVLVLPCGRSAHLELGYAVGAGKRTYVLETEKCEPELMYAMCTRVVTSIADLLKEMGIK